MLLPVVQMKVSKLWVFSLPSSGTKLRLGVEVRTWVKVSPLTIKKEIGFGNSFLPICLRLFRPHSQSISPIMRDAILCWETLYQPMNYLREGTDTRRGEGSALWRRLWAIHDQEECRREGDKKRGKAGIFPGTGKKPPNQSKDAGQGKKKMRLDGLNKSTLWYLKPGREVLT